ncbi:hypothetical protein B0H15DRAFT_846721 [Mycena belliarum]|uniref:Fork-head domain-containing protein n=1 Tax=Mycena belliarum TaxID=1033014 RepID=A0AAD6U165_9AGAR|nr:hypothetical protein B0H15DRAFT_846721 [Mycena belliae]
MHHETHPNYAYSYPSPDRFTSSSAQRSGPRPQTPPPRRRLTGPYYLKNILNSDSEPEIEPSSSKQPEYRQRTGTPSHERSAPLQPSNETAEYLRRQLCLVPGVPVNLWAIADPADGQKPFASLPTLVKLAIHGSPRKRLTLQGICDALVARFTWFHEHRQDDAWKNSVRHNLSLNKVFRKIPRDVTQLGKGCYWELDFSGGEGHKRPRKRRKSDKVHGSDAVHGCDHGYESESVDSHEGTPRAVKRSPQPFREDLAQVPPDSLLLSQPYSPTSRH